MKTLLAAALALSAISTAAAADTGVSERWIDHARRAGVVLVQPDGFDIVAEPASPVMPHDLLVRSTTAEFEIRYLVSPLDEWVASYQSSLTDPALTVVDPNAQMKSSMLVSLLNLSENGRFEEIVELDPAAVERDFGADWGAFAFFNPKPGLGDDDTRGMLFAVHRDDRADVYMVVLYDSEDTLRTELPRSLTALRFTG